MNRWVPAKKRFWARVRIPEMWDCWYWDGNTAGRGYGQFQVDGKKVYAHRYSYELEHGPIPDDMYVCHSCDELLCVNPDHLFLGTPSDNAVDMIIKGRSANTVLSWREAKEIKQSDEQTKVLADRYCVNRTTIQRIRSGKSWGAALAVIETTDE